MNPAAFSIRNRALVNAAMILCLVIGVYSYVTIPRELSPKVGFNWVRIVVQYPGASPAEVESLLTIPIEDEIQSVDDIDVIISSARQGNAFLLVKFDQIPQRDFDRRLEEVRAGVSDVDLPAGAEDPEVSEFSTYDIDPMVVVAVQGDVPESILHRVAGDLRDDLRDVPGVNKVDAFGDRDRAVLVDCDPHQLIAQGIDITEIERAVRLSNLNLPAGIVKLGSEEFLLRTRAEFTGASEVGAVTLRAESEGRRIRVRDVAAVREGFKDRALISRFGGEPAITLSITKQEQGSTIDMVRSIEALLDEWRRELLPAGMKLSLTNDQSILIGEILGVLQSNAVLGLVLVVLALWVFVGWRGSVVATLGIPVTFLIAISAMHWSGDSLNSNTLFGLILVLGMVVDDAVVVLENSFRHLEKGLTPAEAVVKGVGQVMTPVVVSTLTTLGGFLPLVLMSGTMGKVMRIVPIVVSLVLAASLIESLFILPSHFVDIVRGAPKRAKEAGTKWWERLYMGILRRCLRLRYLVVLVCLLLLAGSGALIPIIGVDLLAGEEISSFGVFVTLPDGSRLEKTDAVMSEFERLALELPKEELQGVSLNVGLQLRSNGRTIAPHVGQLTVDVVEAKERERDLDEIMDWLRAATADIPGPVKVEFEKEDTGPPEESPVQYFVKGPELDVVIAASDRLQEELRSMPGLRDVGDDLGELQRELDVIVDREAAARRGLDPTRIARGVRAAFGGTTATTFRDGDEEIDVVVRYPESFRTRLANITNMRFVSPAGDVVPFTEVAELVEGQGPMTIRHHDQERVVTVRADIDTRVTDIGRVDRDIDRFFSQMRSAFPGVHLEPGGQFTEFLEAFNDLAVLFAVGVLINFMLLAGQFKNWSQPLVIMMVAPLSFIGAMLGLVVAGAAFTISTLYGFVALAGVAVNDSIVLVDFINKARASGYDRHQSLIEAGRVRLRPILLTSVTTIFGLLPMALGLGGSSMMWQPLATTIAAGLTVATGISLLVIPCLQAITDDLLSLRERVWRRRVTDADR